MAGLVPARASGGPSSVVRTLPDSRSRASGSGPARTARPSEEGSVESAERALVVVSYDWTRNGTEQPLQEIAANQFVAMLWTPRTESGASPHRNGSQGGSQMARPAELAMQAGGIESQSRRVKSHGSLDADIIIANAPDPVFVSDLEGKILQANDAVSQLLGFRQDEVLEQSLARFISPEETKEFTAALREVVERGVTRNAVLNPRSASGEMIPTSLNAAALRDSDGNVIGAIGVLRDMRELDKARAYAESLIENAPDPVFVSDLEGKILQANEAVSE